MNKHKHNYFHTHAPGSNNNSHQALKYTITYSPQVHKHTQFFLEHAMCLDRLYYVWYQFSFISEAVAPDAYKHIITTRTTTRIMEYCSIQQQQLEMKDNNNNNVCVN